VLKRSPAGFRKSHHRATRAVKEVAAVCRHAVFELGRGGENLGRAAALGRVENFAAAFVSAEGPVHRCVVDDEVDGPVGIDVTDDQLGRSSAFADTHNGARAPPVQKIGVGSDG